VEEAEEKIRLKQYYYIMIIPSKEAQLQLDDDIISFDQIG
jgi:hypothetical protein